MKRRNTKKMNPAFTVSLLLAVTVFIVISICLDIKIFEEVYKVSIDMLITLTDYIGSYNNKRFIERFKKQKILVEKDNIFAKYNRFIENLINDFNMPLTLESFTSLLCILFTITVLIVITIMDHATLSVVIAVSIFIGIATLFIMKSKAIKLERLENIMDAEDLICPLARDGVLVAIKKVMESDEYISSNIKFYFEQFIDNCQYNGYSFKQAIMILNKQLGSKFDNFTKKAIVFEYNERKGMADIFLDIVDENAVLREINNRKERIFRKMNRDFLIKTTLIIIFFIYALSVPEFKQFMINHDIGKIINTIVISIICISFAKCQALQGDLGFGGKQK